MQACAWNHTNDWKSNNVYCLFVSRFNIPINNFFSHVGAKPMLPGF